MYRDGVGWFYVAVERAGNVQVWSEMGLYGSKKG